MNSKSLISITRSLFIAELAVFVVGCSDPNEETMESLDSQAATKAAKNLHC